MTPEQVLADLSQDANVLDGTLYTGKHLIKLLGLDAYRLMSVTISAVAAQDPLVADAQRWLGSTGIDFSDDSTQAMLDVLATVGNWPSEVLAAIKAVGRPLRTKWTDYGGAGDLPTIEANQAEQASYALSQQWNAIKADVDAKVASGELSTLAALRTYVGA